LALIDYFGNDQFLLAAPATANLFINLLAMDHSFVRTFFDEKGHNRIFHVKAPVRPLVLELYISHPDNSNAGDESVFWAPFVRISNLRI
jgi:hypothetical protein